MAGGDRRGMVCYMCTLSAVAISTSMTEQTALQELMEWAEIESWGLEVTAVWRSCAGSGLTMAWVNDSSWLNHPSLLFCSCLVIGTKSSALQWCYHVICKCGSFQIFGNENNVLNYIHEEVKGKLISGCACCLSVQNVLSSCVPSQSL